MITKKKFILSIALGLILALTGCGSGGNGSLKNMVTNLNKETGVAALDKTAEIPDADMKTLGIVEAFALEDRVWGFEGLLVRLEHAPNNNDDASMMYSLFSTHEYTHSARVNDGDYIYIYAYCPNDGARSEFTDYLEALRKSSD